MDWSADFIAAIVRGLFNLGVWMASTLPRLIARFIPWLQNKTTPVTTASEEETAEQTRRADCDRALAQVLKSQGHIARSVISRKELEAKIDSGIQGQDLYWEIQDRIEQCPGLVLGDNAYQAEVPVKLPLFLRDRHMYIIGKSGSGKTNLLRNLIFQDLDQGSGIGVIAPEQEPITEEIMPYIPDERIDDVVYINPADTQCPIALNPLHLNIDEDIDEKVEDFVVIFKRAVGETGARMDEILTQTLYALIARPGSTLLDVERLLSRENTVFRTEV
jgi:Helicase HerA, central domain